VDYGQAVKFYEAEPIGPGRYSPPRVVRSERTVIAGNPDMGHISTSLIERQNLTMRMSMRRFTRLTNGFSKKVENMKAAVSLHFAHYNFVRLHRTLRVMQAGPNSEVSSHLARSWLSTGPNGPSILKKPAGNSTASRSLSAHRPLSSSITRFSSFIRSPMPLVRLGGRPSTLTLATRAI
jgi:hypothetical protein